MKHLLAIFALLIGTVVLVPFSAAKDTRTDPTLTGKWHFVLDTEGGDRELDSDFQVEGDQVSGKFGKTDVKGTFTDGKLNLEFAMNSDEAGPGTMKIKGDLAGDTLSGNWSFQEYGGAFKASRVKE